MKASIPFRIAEQRLKDIQALLNSVKLHYCLPLLGRCQLQQGDGFISKGEACNLQAGHAFAAAAEGVGIHHVAAFSIVLLPGAFVALDTETMAVLSPARTLKASLPSSAAWNLKLQPEALIAV